MNVAVIGGSECSKEVYEVQKKALKEVGGVE